MQSPDSKQKLATGIAGIAPFVASCLWGGMYVVSKASFNAIPPITLGLARLLVGGLALWFVLWLSQKLRPGEKRPISTQEKRRLPLLGACIAGSLATQFVGTNLATAHDGALLTTTTPIFIVPIAWFLLKERPHWRVLLGMLIALLGVIMVVGVQDNAASETIRSGKMLFGDLLLIVSSLFWALFTVLGTPLVRTMSALVVTTYATLWSLVFFAPLALWELFLQPLGALSYSALVSVLYLGIGSTALAWFLWYKGVERLPASVSAVFIFAQPLVGGLLSALFLQEVLGINFWLGGIILAIGILLVSLQHSR